MSVRVDGYNQIGTVLDTQKGDSVFVQLGPLKLTVKAIAVHPASAAQQQQTVKAKPNIGLQRAQTATTGEIGRSVHEAATGSASIAENISGVAQAAGAVTSGATETKRTAADLSRMAGNLRQVVSAYRT